MRHEYKNPYINTILEMKERFDVLCGHDPSIEDRARIMGSLPVEKPGAVILAGYYFP